jgi:hypothetical protein
MAAGPVPEGQALGVYSMSILLIEAILDRYVAKVQRRNKDWTPKEVEALLLELRVEVLECLK